jgi:site-specific DNA-cytosine methylase
VIVREFPLNILCACEESQAVCNELRKLGHNAFSNDIIDCSGSHPEYHMKCDVSVALREREWDMVIAFPPCTNLAVSGARWFPQKRADGSQQRSIDFFMQFVTYAEERDCMLSIENPIGIMSTHYRKPDQIIQPWQFGHGETKATCLWLRGLPKLEPTNIVDGREARIWKLPPSKDRGKLRSKTYYGIAQAMAEQWAGLCLI